MLAWLVKRFAARVREGDYLPSSLPFGWCVVRAEWPEPWLRLLVWLPRGRRRWVTIMPDPGEKLEDPFEAWPVWLFAKNEFPATDEFRSASRSWYVERAPGDPVFIPCVPRET